MAGKGDEESFMSLEDEVVKPIKSKTQKKAKKPVEKALENYGSPIYVQHEIVHNKHVVMRLQNNGVIFVDDVGQIPEGSHVIYSAHGVSPEVRKRSKKLNLKVLDATCPLVTKVHGEAKRYAQKDHIIMV